MKTMEERVTYLEALMPLMLQATMGLNVQVLAIAGRIASTPAEKEEALAAAVAAAKTQSEISTLMSRVQP